jgi:pimeloyl-ACP methyl ester carboxylesterase
MVLVRPAWLNEPAPRNLAMFQVIARMIQQSGIQQARRLFGESDIYREWQAVYPQAATSVEGFFAGPSQAAIAATFHTVPGSVPYRETDELKHIHAPALVVGNRTDPIHPFDYAVALASALPNAQLKEIPCKTQGAEEHASAFRRYLQEFLRSISEVSDMFVARQDVRFN